MKILFASLPFTTIHLSYSCSLESYREKIFSYPYVNYSHILSFLFFRLNFPKSFWTFLNAVAKCVLTSHRQLASDGTSVCPCQCEVSVTKDSILEVPCINLDSVNLSYSEHCISMGSPQQKAWQGKGRSISFRDGQRCEV